MARSTEKPSYFAETDADLANQLQLLANEVPGMSTWDEIGVTFCRAEIQRVIAALRVGAKKKRKASA